MQLTIVHDHLAQRGGAERVALALAQNFPDARFVTSVYDADRTYPEFRDVHVETLWPNNVPWLASDPRRAFPFLRSAFSRLRIDDSDVVLCSSSGWAHGVSGTTPRVVYCHNPPRWLYQQKDYLLGLPRPARPVLRALEPSLRSWDLAAARSATSYITISTAVQDRVTATYERSSLVLPPPVTLEAQGDVEVPPTAGSDFYLTVGRPRGYKHTHLVCEAFARRPDLRLVCVGGLDPTVTDWPSNIVGLNNLTDAHMRWLYQNCLAVVSMAQEDFGLTPIEGFLAGRPAILVREGGFLDSQRPGVTGEFVPERSAGALGAVIDDFDPGAYDPAVIRAHGANYRVDNFIRRLTDELDSAARGRGK